MLVNRRVRVNLRTSDLLRRYHGGWLAPNIYFLGFAGCVQVNGIRIAGASGIYSVHHYNLGELKSPFIDEK